MNILGNDVPAMGMGCWAIGGPFYKDNECLGLGAVDDKESIKTIHAAYEAGIRLFDTAAVYGAGHSERLLGSALKSHTDAIVVSKLGLEFDEESKQLIGEQPSADAVEAAIDASLMRLDRDCIDVMLLHINELAIDQAQLIFEQMDKARSAGKIRAYGWSTDFPNQAAAMADQDGFIGIEHAMNVFIDVPTIQSTVAKHNLLALIRSPLAMGVLSGKYNTQTSVSQTDHRASAINWSDYFTGGKASAKYTENIENIRELLQSDGRTLVQGALSWLLAKSPNNIPLPGARTSAQIIESAAAIQLGPLEDSVMAEIETCIVREPEGPPRSR